MLKLIFNLFEKRFIKYLHQKNGTKTTKDNLSYAFCDLDGFLYYSFPRELQMPLIRLGKLQDFYTWMASRVSGEELERMMDYADASLTGVVSGDKKGLAKVGFVLSELKERKNMIIHADLYYNILAAQIVRSDENVNEWNQEIHDQKVIAFKKMDQESDYFFLHTNELRKQLISLDITREALLSKLRESTEKINALATIMARG